MKKRTFTLQSLFQNSFNFSLARVLSLAGMMLLAFSLSANGPCTAVLYDFGGGAGNVVPCGPSANTTSSVPIDGAGVHVQGASNIMASNLDCATNGELESGNGPDVLWVTFVINTGGSFEWQTVPGADKFTWTLFYATDPVDMASEETTQSGCSNLVKVACDDQFTGWQVVSTPDPTKRWRFYLALYLNDADKNDVGDGVVKIRKSCGLACEGSGPTVSIDDVCINSGNTILDASGATGGGGGPYAYIWSDDNGVIAGETSSTLSVSTAGTYTVVVTGADGCPGSDQATVTVGGCCEADAGAINGLTQDETLCFGRTTLDAISFSTDADPQPTGYSYALFLVDASGNIVNPPGASAGTSTTFSFSTLPAGMYNIYGVSYLNNQGAGSAQAYVNGFPTLGDLQTDIAGATCAELAMHAFKVTIQSGNVDCNGFPFGG